MQALDDDKKSISPSPMTLLRVLNLYVYTSNKIFIQLKMIFQKFLVDYFGLEQELVSAEDQ